jgi:hypothetical protein
MVLFLLTTWRRIGEDFLWRGSKSAAKLTVPLLEKLRWTNIRAVLNEYCRHFNIATQYRRCLIRWDKYSKSAKWLNAEPRVPSRAAGAV